MSIKKAYNAWANTYDMVANKTRDLEEIAARSRLQANYNHILELGCGTGKTPYGFQKKHKP